MFRYRNWLTALFSKRIMTASTFRYIHYITITLHYFFNSSKRRSFDKLRILNNNLSHLDIINTSLLALYMVSTLIKAALTIFSLQFPLKKDNTKSSKIKAWYYLYLKISKKNNYHSMLLSIFVIRKTYGRPPRHSGHLRSHISVPLA